MRKRRGSLIVVVAAVALLALPSAASSAQPIELAAPYEYLGWGDPQAPASVLASTGVRDLTLAFILSHGACDPMWDGSRPLKGGADQAAIEAIRSAGGDVVVSFGGWSGKKLGSSCKSPALLAAAYQKVLDAYALKAIDVDIEHGEFTSAKVRRRVVEALALLQRANPALAISITLGTGEAGPESAGRSLIADAAAIGFQPAVWTVMPFDFGGALSDMGHASTRAVEGLAQDLVSAYGISATAAYQHAGISSMNGHTDEPSETITLEDFETMLSFAQLHHLGRLSFWSVNRDRPCGGSDTSADSCSAIAQQPYAFTKLIAQYHG